MKNKEQSDAITSGHVGPKLTGLGRAPTSGVCGLWPQRHCLPLSGMPENSIELFCNIAIKVLTKFRGTFFHPFTKCFRIIACSTKPHRKSNLNDRHIRSLQ